MPAPPTEENLLVSTDKTPEGKQLVNGNDTASSGKQNQAAYSETLAANGSENERTVEENYNAACKDGVVTAEHKEDTWMLNKQKTENGMSDTSDKHNETLQESVGNEEGNAINIAGDTVERSNDEDREVTAERQDENMLENTTNCEYKSAEENKNILDAADMIENKDHEKKTTKGADTGSKEHTVHEFNVNTNENACSRTISTENEDGLINHAARQNEEKDDNKFSEGEDCKIDNGDSSNALTVGSKEEKLGKLPEENQEESSYSEDTGTHVDESKTDTSKEGKPLPESECKSDKEGPIGESTSSNTETEKSDQHITTHLEIQDIPLIRDSSTGQVTLQSNPMCESAEGNTAGSNINVDVINRSREVTQEMLTEESDNMKTYGSCFVDFKEDLDESASSQQCSNTLTENTAENESSQGKETPCEVPKDNAFKKEPCKETQSSDQNVQNMTAVAITSISKSVDAEEHRTESEEEHVTGTKEEVQSPNMNSSTRNESEDQRTDAVNMLDSSGESEESGDDEVFIMEPAVSCQLGMQEGIAMPYIPNHNESHTSTKSMNEDKIKEESSNSVPKRNVMLHKNEIPDQEHDKVVHIHGDSNESDQTDINVCEYVKNGGEAFEQSVSIKHENETSANAVSLDVVYVDNVIPCEEYNDTLSEIKTNYPQSENQEATTHMEKLGRIETSCNSNNQSEDFETSADPISGKHSEEASESKQYKDCKNTNESENLESVTDCKHAENIETVQFNQSENIEITQSEQHEIHRDTESEKLENIQAAESEHSENLQIVHSDHFKTIESEQSENFQAPESMQSENPHITEYEGLQTTESDQSENLQTTESEQSENLQTTESEQSENLQTTESEQSENLQTTESEQSENLQTTESEQSENLQTTESEQSENLQTPESEQSENPHITESEGLQTTESEQSENLQTTESEQSENLQTTESEQSENLQTTESEQSENLQTTESEQSENLQTTEPEQSENLQTPESEQSENLQTTESEQSENLQTTESEQSENLQTTESEQSENLQTTESEQSENLQTTESEQSENLNIKESEGLQTTELEQSENLNIKESEDLQTPESVKSENLQLTESEDLQTPESEQSENLHVPELEDLQAIELEQPENLQTPESVQSKNLPITKSEHLQTTEPEQSENLQTPESEQSENLQTTESEQSENLQTTESEQSENLQTTESEQSENLQTTESEQSENLQTTESEQSENLNIKESEGLQTTESEQSENLQTTESEQSENLNIKESEDLQTPESVKSENLQLTESEDLQTPESEQSENLHVPELEDLQAIELEQPENLQTPESVQSKNLPITKSEHLQTPESEQSENLHVPELEDLQAIELEQPENLQTPESVQSKNLPITKSEHLQTTESEQSEHLHVTELKDLQTTESKHPENLHIIESENLQTTESEQSENPQTPESVQTGNINISESQDLETIESEQSENCQAPEYLQSENLHITESEDLQKTESDQSENFQVAESDQSKNIEQRVEYKQCENNAVVSQVKLSEPLEKFNQSENLEATESNQSEHHEAKIVTEQPESLQTVFDPNQSEHVSISAGSEALVHLETRAHSECSETIVNSEVSQNLEVKGGINQYESLELTYDPKMSKCHETMSGQKQPEHLQILSKSEQDQHLETSNVLNQSNYLDPSESNQFKHFETLTESKQTENFKIAVESKLLEQLDISESKESECIESTAELLYAEQTENCRITTDLKESEKFRAKVVDTIEITEDSRHLENPKTVTESEECEKTSDYRHFENSDFSAEFKHEISEECAEEHAFMLPKIVMVDKETQIPVIEHIERASTVKLSQPVDSSNRFRKCSHPGVHRSISREKAKDGVEMKPENSLETAKSDTVHNSKLQCTKKVKVVELLENVMIRPVPLDACIQTDEIPPPEVHDKYTETPVPPKIEMVSVSTEAPLPEPVKVDSIAIQTLPEVRPEKIEAQTQTPPLQTKPVEEPSAAALMSAVKNDGVNLGVRDSLWNKSTGSVFDGITSEEEDAFAHMQYRIEVLKNGYSFVEESGNMKADCTITLVTGKHKVLVDTGSPWDRKHLLRALQERGLQPSQIDYVVCTHGHLDNVGNLNLFENATFIVNFDISNQETYLLHEMDQGKPYIIDEDLAVIGTPGHSIDDISLVVSNTELGIVVIAGDLFENEDDQKDPSLWRNNSSNPKLQEKNRQKVLRMADYIVPGHGKMFKVPTRPK